MALATTKAPICGFSAQAASSYETFQFGILTLIFTLAYVTGILMFNYALIEIDRRALGQGSHGIGGRRPPQPLGYEISTPC